MYKEIEIINNNTSNIESVITKNKIIKQITKDIVKSKKQLEILDNEISIIQQMIRVVWVNDVVDTLESQVSKVKVKK